MVDDLLGSAAVVFGGAHGIGKATARLLAERGARVLVADLDAEAGVRTCDEIGPRATFVALDVTDERAVADAVGRDVLGAPLRIVVHSIYTDRKAPVETLARANWQHVVDTILGSAYIVTRAAVPALRANGGGSVTFISSIQALLGYPHEPAYAAAKAGLCGLSHQVAVEYGGDGVRANCVLPSFILTERERARFVDDPDRLSRMADAFPLRRIGTAEDVAEAVAFLASARASFITGVDLLVDGGFSLQPATHHLGRSPAPVSNLDQPGV